MRKKIFVVILGTILCFGICFGLAKYNNTNVGSKNYEKHSKLISIENENDLYYYSTTHIVYIIFNERDEKGYGYMSPYYSENGRLCTYDTNTKQIIEIEE